MLYQDLTNWMYVFVRVSALLLALPLFTATPVPVTVRIALCALTAAVISPSLPSAPPMPSTVWGLFALFFSEASVGLLLGFVCRFVFFAVDLAGGLISAEMGLSMSTMFNPLAPSTTPVTSVTLYWLALVMFLSLDLHHWMLAGLQQSYLVVPVGGAHLSEVLLNDVILRSGHIFVIALQIAAPIMAVSFLITLVFALLGRAVPQMNVFYEGTTAKTLAGLLTFGVTCTLMGQHIANYLRRLPTDLMKVASLLGTA
ncbi:MAG TPA: flagellar biosynthetic protein FliR, partial [Candidatus Limnocylindria bacterium]|jgi:flagellar biosynthetic protein FliR|nr:flagellar biosynthetic protein FliR [Candidatus Limnocylindria bacterium]